MRKIFLLTATLLATAAQAQTGQGYKIDGQVTGIPDNTVLYLRTGERMKVKDSVQIKNGTFTFTGPEVEKPICASIRVKGKSKPVCDFFLENGKISIKGDEKKTVASGTENNDLNIIYERNITSYYDTFDALNKQISEAEGKKADSLLAIKERIIEEKKAKEVDFIKKYPNSLVSAYIVGYRAINASSRQIKELVSYLSDDQQSSRTIKRVINHYEKLEKIEAGQQAIDFTLTDSEGKEFTLSSEKGRYVLLDFWASWCGPCRKSFPAIKAIYEEYANEPLTIIGVSIDAKEEHWRKALEKEQAPWRMLRDSKGNVADDYAVYSIPLLVLIDPDGKVIGRFHEGNIKPDLKRIFGK